MKLRDATELNEARGSGVFDYKYFFWAKKELNYGIGYARQDIQLDIARKGNAALDALENIKDVLSTLPDTDGELSDDQFEVIERKVKANTKRLIGVLDLFASPIVVNWLSKEQKPTIVSVPKDKPDDVVDLDGKHIDVAGLFRDPNTREFVVDVMDWDKVVINDKKGDTLNTITAKFIAAIFGSASSAKNIRKIARGAGLDEIMKSLKFEADGTQIVPFEKKDYKLFPEEMVGTKKAPEMIQSTIENKFKKVFTRAREVFA